VGSLIDTGVFIAAERGRLDLKAVLAEVSGEPIGISAITAAELLDGVNRADPAHRRQRESIVEDILARFPVLAFDLSTARVYGTLLTERARLGRPIAPHDLLIAATAMSLGYRVVTRDRRSFPEIAGLDVLLR
jgi:tRNA(fMet)-specific endonuclease VapC